MAEVTEGMVVVDEGCAVEKSDIYCCICVFVTL